MNKQQRRNVLAAVVRDLKTNKRTVEQVGNDLDRVFTQAEIEELWDEWRNIEIELGYDPDEEL